MNKLKKKLTSTDWLATISGLVTAVATAWLTIDWTTFDINKEWPKLLLSAAIAAGGYFSKFKTNKDLQE
jgi:hypothetical protein